MTKTVSVFWWFFFWKIKAFKGQLYHVPNLQRDLQKENDHKKEEAERLEAETARVDEVRRLLEEKQRILMEKKRLMEEKIAKIRQQNETMENQKK